MKLSNHIDNARKNGGKVTDFIFGVFRGVAVIIFLVMVYGEFFR